jgi:hypothetical protein
MKISINRNAVIFSIILLVFFICIDNTFAQGPNLNQIDGQVQNATSKIKSWGHLIIGAVFVIAAIFSIYALSSGNPQAKTYVIGTVVGLVFWAIITVVVG